MEQLLGPAIELLRCIIYDPAANCWKHHRGVEENLAELTREMETLNTRKKNIELRQATELKPGKTLGEDVKRWLEKVEKINEEMKIIEESVEKVSYFSRAGLGKDIFLKIDLVQRLYTAGNFDSDSLFISLPKRGELLPTNKILGGEATFKKKMDEIFTYLTDDNEVRSIGVYGMSGVGKTIALEHINNRLVEDQGCRFEHVIWINVAIDMEVRHLQDRIAHKLDLDISMYEDEPTRAIKLHEMLITKKRYVLILDDLQRAYPLKDVGIPEPAPECRLVLTTHSDSVCRSIRCQKVIKMEPPSENEALKLLSDIVDCAEYDSIPSELKAIMKDVVRACDRLPLAIVTIGNKLTGWDYYMEWEIVLEELRDFMKGSVSSEIIKKLKYSYDHLNNEKYQECLLYCALYPEGYPIERGSLIEHLVAEGIINKKETRRSDILMANAALIELEKVCLLNKTINYQGAECVKMHNLIRDMSKQITSCSPLYYIQAGLGLKSIPSEENWKVDLDKVSLMNNNISDIPASVEPKCPKLSTLLLCNNGLKSISNNFFIHMTGLGLLDLSYTKIVKLPESVSNLVALTALFLRGCNDLRYMPSLGKLVDLRKLDLYNTGLEELPEGMEKLVKLQYLNFWGSGIGSIPEGILCKLSNLQYLSVLSGRLEGPRVKAEELEYLRKLETFHGELNDINNYNTYAQLLSPEDGPTCYVLQLGFSNPQADFDCQKVVFLTKYNVKESVATQGCRLVLPETMEQLVLRECFIDVSSVCDLMLFEKATNLRSIEIKRCGELEHLFSDSASIFPLLTSLKKLDLDGLSKFGGLIKWEGSSGASSAFPPNAFSSLKELRMCNCPLIKILFPIASLPDLEVLFLSNCEQLEEIISTTSTVQNQSQNQDGGTGGSNVVTLPKLRRLHLSALHTLRSIPVISDSLEEIEIRGCPKLKRIPPLDREALVSSLKRVDIGGNLWQSLKWDHINAKYLIQSMFMNTEVNMRTAYFTMSSIQAQELEQAKKGRLKLSNLKPCMTYSW